MAPICRPQISQTPISGSGARGLTLVEVLCTVSIVAILSAIAIPNLGDLRRSVARRTAVNELMHAVFLARSKAIMTNSVVSLCPSGNGIRCGEPSSNWADGWIVFRNSDGDLPAVRDPNEEIIYRNSGWIGGLVTSNRDSYSFRATSQFDVNGTMIFCDLRRKSADARAIIISHTGRPRIALRDASNRAIRCPAA
jgi:type IV fimbrial biogenesis protein FimT